MATSLKRAQEPTLRPGGLHGSKNCYSPCRRSVLGLVVAKDVGDGWPVTMSTGSESVLPLRLWPVDRPPESNGSIDCARFRKAPPPVFRTPQSVAFDFL